MATLTCHVEFQMGPTTWGYSEPIPGDWAIVTSTMLEWQSSNGILTETMTGTFFFDAEGYLDGGTLRTWEQDYLGDPIFTMTGINKPILDVLALTDRAFEEFMFADADTLNGSAYNDILYAHASNDRVFGNGGADQLHGGDGNDSIWGGDGNDLLVGEAGYDMLAGGMGNDNYVTDGRDTIVEYSGQGTDTIQTSTSLSLAVNFENLLLLGTASINGTGNAGSNQIRGNYGDNTLNGGGGTDYLYGGSGNDTYITDGGDTIVETATGIDTVLSSASCVLSDRFVENLVLTGTGAINGTGNSSANRITGNGAANTIDGGTGGLDVLMGGAGNDTYLTDFGDTVIEAAGAGTDTVISKITMTLSANVENLVLQPNLAINGTGNTGANDLTGNNVTNTLNGMAGNDVLTGGSGADSFVFSTALGSGNVDRITDFNVAADTIWLENAIFTGLAAGTLAASAFVGNTSGNAADASDRIIYETDTGRLYFDRDGTGSAAKVHFATIGTNLAVTNADFFVF